jgi:hypothetical protein
MPVAKKVAKNPISNRVRVSQCRQDPRIVNARNTMQVASPQRVAAPQSRARGNNLLSRQSCFFSTNYRLLSTYCSLRQRASAHLRELFECALAGESRCRIREGPCGIALYSFVFADLRLILPIGGGAFHVRQKLCRASKHPLCLLAVRAPKRAVKDHSFIFEALCKGIKPARPGFRKK